MKYFIAFMLLLLTNCGAPTAISAATNPTNVTPHSVVFPVKKLSFKQKLLIKLSKKNVEDIPKIQFFLFFGVLLFILGVILIINGKRIAAAAPKVGLVPSFDGLGETFLGGASIGVACLFIGLYISKKKSKK